MVANFTFTLKYIKNHREINVCVYHFQQHDLLHIDFYDDRQKTPMEEKLLTLSLISA